MAEGRLGLPEKIAISLFDDPAGACEMAVIGAPCPIGFVRCINAKYMRGDLAPRRSCICGVEDSQVLREMCPVVIGQLRVIGRGVCNGPS